MYEPYSSYAFKIAFSFTRVAELLSHFHMFLFSQPTGMEYVVDMFFCDKTATFQVLLWACYQLQQQSSA